MAHYRHASPSAPPRLSSSDGSFFGADQHVGNWANRIEQLLNFQKTLLFNLEPILHSYLVLTRLVLLADLLARPLPTTIAGKLPHADRKKRFRAMI